MRISFLRCLVATALAFGLAVSAFAGSAKPKVVGLLFSADRLLAYAAQGGGL